MYPNIITPEDRYRSYQKFLRKQEYRRAYQCLEKLLKEFPDDMELLEGMIALCLNSMKSPKLAKTWLQKRIKLHPVWYDYAVLSRIETDIGSISKAKEYFTIAATLQKKQHLIGLSKKSGKNFLVDTKKFIEFKEQTIKNAPIYDKPPKKIEIKKKKESVVKKIEPPSLSPSPPQTINKAHIYKVPIQFDMQDCMISKEMFQNVSTLKECQLRSEYAHLNIQRTFDDLFCLSLVTGIEKYWYQIETVKKVLKYFHGRVLLSDEVGLGKTIEAGLLMKEYLLRGMIRNILILTPAPLVSQWKEEMHQKFDIEFVTTEDAVFQTNPDEFWKNQLIISSIHTAKGNKNFAKVIDRFYDLVIVDEAHHLKNSKTLTWKLVNKINKRFIFLLTATPVQNNLIELFNLITLLKPGQFKTEKIFKKEYMLKGNAKTPANKEKLRELLRDVMIRNTRSSIDLKLPKRFASTIRLEALGKERQIYENINRLVRRMRETGKKSRIPLLLKQSGSSPFTLKETLRQLKPKYNDIIAPILDCTNELQDTAKGKALLELLLKNPNEKKVVFVQFLKSMDYITSLIDQKGFPYVIFRGDMTAHAKDEAINRFKDDVPLLISTESGGEGRNLQWCNTLINFDLPWNPMKIEQRIGRLHRIGQTREVFIFNLSVKNTIEDHIIDVLDSKINMFEMVIGEIEPILGYLEEDREFEEIAMELWLRSRNQDEAQSNFDNFGQKMISAKKDYLRSKTLDKELFEEDYAS